MIDASKWNSSALWSAMVACTLIAASASAAPSEPVVTSPGLIPIIPDRVYVPKGFDDNDNSQIVLTGDLPNTCYRVGPEQLNVDHERREIRITDLAYFYPYAVCLQTLVPYSKVINLGPMRAGSYRVVFEGAHGATQDFEALPVARAITADPDDFLYASVDDAFIDWDPSGASYIVIRGDITSTCNSLKEVRVLREPGDVIVVLPIARLDQGPECSEIHEAFERRIPLVDPPESRTLLHVRSLHGRSINKIIGGR
ncbi:MAG: hypothetical protein IT285_01580 [Bdellovibrionales bacterium]|nr:hypothetical protein [Bdellovibrionales bacterium]